MKLAYTHENNWLAVFVGLKTSERIHPSNNKIYDLVQADLSMLPSWLQLHSKPSSKTQFSTSSTSVLLWEHWCLREIGSIRSNKPIVTSDSAESAHFLTIHIIWYQFIVPMLNKENQILIRMNGGHIVVRSKLAALFPKQLWKAHGVLKDPNG